MKNIEALANWIRTNAMTDENRFSNGELNWNFIEADIVTTAEGCDVRDPLPALPFHPTYEDIDAAFDLIDDPCADAWQVRRSMILTLEERKG